MSKKVVYIGLERCDFIYQLAIIASIKGTVLLVDNSRTKDLFSIIGKDTNDEIIERRNMHITRNLDVSASDVTDYDFVFIYSGMVADKNDYVGENTTILAMPDYTDICLRAVEKNLPADIDNLILIMRDQCTKKINEKGIAQRLNISRSNVEGKIPLSLNDIAAYVAFSHNGKQNIAALSDTMQTALTYVTGKLFGLDEKSAAKLVARARKY